MTTNVRKTLARFVDRLLLRSELSSEEVEALVSIECSVAHFATHRDIVSIGRPVDFACLVGTGMAARFDQLANGRRQITALHIRGDMCDLHSVAVPVPGWGIQALLDTEIVRVPHQALKALTLNYPSIAYAFWRDTITDGSVLAKWVSVLGQRSGKARLAHLLCEMGLRMEQGGLATRRDFSLKLTQAQIADVLGMTPVHVNRVFQRLRQEGAVTADNGAFRVEDYKRLLSLAEFDPQYLLLPELKQAAVLT